MELQTECVISSLGAAAGRQLRRQQVVKTRAASSGFHVKSGVCHAGDWEVTLSVTKSYTAAAWQAPAGVAVGMNGGTSDELDRHSGMHANPLAGRSGAACTLGAVLTVQHQGRHQLFRAGARQVAQPCQRRDTGILRWSKARQA